MNTINESFTTTLEVKQSKFITHLMPYVEYETYLKKLKDEHPKARHFVVAFRYLNEFNQIVEHSSDDGEPKGTSGKPSLFVLQGAHMINCAVVVVRYFGGTKLGTGGLVRAYSDAVNLVLSNASLLEYKDEISKKIKFEYSNLRMVEYDCESCGIRVVDKAFDSGAVFEIRATESDLNIFLQKVDRIVTLV